MSTCVIPGVAVSSSRTRSVTCFRVNGSTSPETAMSTTCAAATNVRVMVRYSRDERRSLGDLENMRIRTPDGGEVPFG